MREAVIVSMVRTPVGKYAGGLSSISSAKLASIVIKEAVDRAQIDHEIIDDVIIGNIMNYDWQNIARVATLAAGLPIETPAITFNRECGTGADAVAYASMVIQCGYADVIVAGGIESDSTRPYVMKKPTKAFQYTCPEMFNDPPSVTDEIGEVSMIETAENVARQYNITRSECDEFAVRSHTLADAAWKRGFFDEQIVKITVPQRKKDPFIVDKDETLRPESTVDILGKLRPVLESGLVTAGNSSPLCDGAAAIVLMEKSLAKSLGCEIIGKVIGYAVAGVHPHYMGVGPIHATRKLLRTSGVKLDDIDIIELNEAFAAQAIPCCRELGLDMSKVNVNGGAIALGHPMGATGAILIQKALRELKQREKRIGLVTMCIGGGQGIALLVERL